MAIVSNYDNKKKNLATTVYTGATLNGAGNTTNLGNGKFANQITPNTQTYYTGASLSGNGTMQNAGNGKFATNINLPTPTNTDSGNGAVAQAAPAVASDPYASIYSLYEQQMNAQRDALNQQRQARLNALQANYNNAKNQLDSSFASGETELNQDADRALREAYVANKLNQRDMAQYLAGQGVTGGAAESILANLYNTYGNNRNNIETNRADNLRALLANYQGTLGDIENSYLSGMADADSDYSGAIANALTSYYGNLADMQKQNIANQYKAALGKSGTSSSSKTEEASLDLNKDIVNGLKNYKGDLTSARNYLSFMGVPEAQWDMYLQNTGFGGDMATANQEAATRSIPNSVRTSVLNTLRQVASLSRGTDDLERNLASQMDQLASIYGLNQEQATALLKELGF